jgi:hypothetical protein
MSRDDEAGAVAAATYFMTELYPYTISSLDTAPWQSMSHSECLFCRSVKSDVETLRSAGRIPIVAPIGIESTSIKMLNPLAFSVVLEITTGPDETFTANGTRLEKTTQVSGSATVIVVHQAGAWLTRGVDLKERA